MVLGRFVRSLACVPLLLALVVPEAHATPMAAPRQDSKGAASFRGNANLVRNVPSRLSIQAPASPATPNLDVPVSRLAAQQQLRSVVKKVETLSGAGKPAVVVFDIDDTLTKWKKDDTVAGARDYVKALKQSGATIVYITGRREGMRAETVEHLKQHGFPIGSSERLVLNNTGLKVPAFKAKAAQSIVKSIGTPVAAFDNEKDNARVFRRALPNSMVFRLRTTSQKGDHGGLGRVSVIRDFTPFTSGD